MVPSQLPCMATDRSTYRSSSHVRYLLPTSPNSNVGCVRAKSIPARRAACCHIGSLPLTCSRRQKTMHFRRRARDMATMRENQTKNDENEVKEWRRQYPRDDHVGQRRYVKRRQYGGACGLRGQLLPPTRQVNHQSHNRQGHTYQQHATERAAAANNIGCVTTDAAAQHA
jgi:hypothetical protein